MFSENAFFSANRRTIATMAIDIIWQFLHLNAAELEEFKIITSSDIFLPITMNTIGVTESLFNFAMISTADSRTHLCWRRSFRFVAGRFEKTRDRDYLPAAAVLVAIVAVGFEL